MKVFIYETESSVGEGPEVQIIAAKDREAADKVIKQDSGYPLNAFKVEEKELTPNTIIFAGIVPKRIDEHSYSF